MTRDQRASGNGLTITFDELKQWAVRGTIMKHLFRYREVHLVAYRSDLIVKPFLTAVLLRLLSRWSCIIEDGRGNRERVTFRNLIDRVARLTKDFLDKRKAIRLIKNEVSTIVENIVQDRIISTVDITSGRPVYLRSDLWFNVSSGGSVGHIAGVLNHLDCFTGKPVFISSDLIPTVRQDIETHYIDPEPRFWDFLELPGLYYNNRFYNSARAVLENSNVSFVYQRYSLNNYSGILLSAKHRVPFVLEYNGSEIWVNRNWGERLKYEALSERIEILNLKAAHLIVVVSEPLKRELEGRGIEPNKILVNPNGVNPDRYSPDADGSRVRSHYALNDQVVVGFIGTFGKWHGAEVLAEAFGLLLKKHPELRSQVRLLMIGDGVTMPLVKEVLSRHDALHLTIFTGRIPQEEGPVHLSACDILASPHVPNPDGSPFFGSPTKLFEYMAMGKGIVASDLDQIGEILEHDKTAWMVKPGDADALMLGLKKLIDIPDLRNRLGTEARKEVVAHYTWRKHTQKIVERLHELLKERN